jgi:predicted RND superfamily exporter protein
VPTSSGFYALLVSIATRHPRAVIVTVFAVTLALGLGLRNGLDLEVSPYVFIEEANPARADYEQVRKDFGDDTYLVVAVGGTEIFSAESLGRLRSLHEALARVPGVQEIVSLASVPFARSEAGGASIERLIPDNLDSAERLNEARRVATTDRIFVGQVVSADARTAALTILLDPLLPTAARHGATEQIDELAHKSGFPEVFLAGDPVSQWQSTRAMKRDLRLFLPLTLLLVAFLLWLSFGSVAGVIVPLMTIGLGLIWVLGTMSFMGAQFTILALMLPTLLLAIGCSYMIHVVNQVGIEEQLDPGASTRQIVERALRFIAVPVIVSALTIMAGFLSLTFSSLPAIRATAVYAALGAAITMVLSLTFVPACLIALDKPGRRVTAMRVGMTGPLRRLLERLGQFATRHQMGLYIITGLIVVASFFGMRRIAIDIDYFHFFKPSSGPSRAMAEIDRRLGGVISFSLIVDGDKPGSVETQPALQQIVEVQRIAEKEIAGVDRTLSVADFVRHLNRAFHGNNPAFDSIPPPQALNELLADHDPIKAFVTSDGRRARILVRSRVTGSRGTSRLVKDLEERARALLPDFHVFATGTVVLMNRTSDAIARDQFQSITIALLTIYAMLALLFRSLRVGLTALVPNLVPILVFFGFMGWRGIALNVTTSLVASVVLGLAVDNAVQFIVRFRRVQQKTSDLREAIIESMCLSGRPIIYANIALAAAFAVFAMSNFDPVSSFGLLSAVTILGCLVEDLILLPSRLTSPVFAVRRVSSHKEAQKAG